MTPLNDAPVAKSSMPQGGKAPLLRPSPPAAVQRESRCAVGHGPSGQRNTYADPQLLPAAQLSSGAPTTAVSPLTETERPNLSSAAASEAVSFCSWIQPVPLKRKTYADPPRMPAAQSSPYAPTTAASPGPSGATGG